MIAEGFGVVWLFVRLVLSNGGVATLARVEGTRQLVVAIGVKNRNGVTHRPDLLFFISLGFLLFQLLKLEEFL
jgi:hypothetical protein